MTGASLASAGRRVNIGLAYREQAAGEEEYSYGAMQIIPGLILASILGAAQTTERPLEVQSKRGAGHASVPTGVW